MNRAMLLVLATLLAGCGQTAIDAARKSIAAAEQIQVAGIQVFEQFDLAKQQGIVAKAATPADARLQLDTYRETRRKVVLGFQSLADASHAAKNTVDALAAKNAGQLDLGAVLGALYSAGLALRDAAALVGFSVPGLDSLIGKPAGGAP